MVKVKRIKAPRHSRLREAMSSMDREHPRRRTLMVRDGKRNKVKLDEFAAAVETAKTLSETEHFQTVYEK
jgi:hypothetical protein